MSVTDFECAIAKSQIGRYIAGDNLAPEVSRQLESHIDNCTRCKQLLQEKKNSLEAMIGSTTTDEQTTIKVTNNPVVMTRPTTDGSSALKPDFMEVLADSARLSLREKLKQSAGISAPDNEIPIVAPAFAYQNATNEETPEPETIAKESIRTKKRFDLSMLALFKNIPDEETKPSMTIDNIWSAKAVFRDNNPSLKKPVMYLAGLCCVVAAMSFVLRDPTTLFGGKVVARGAALVVPVNGKSAIKTAKLNKKPSSKVEKVLPHKPTQLNDQGTDAHSFTNEPAPKKATPVKTVKATKKVAKVTVPVHKKAVKHATKKVAAQHFVKAKKPTIHSTHKKHHSTSTENTVKLYTPDSTPHSQEQK